MSSSNVVQSQDKQINNQGFRNTLASLEQVIGADNMEKVLTSAGLPQYIGNYPPSNKNYGGHKVTYSGAVHKAVYEMYGERGGARILEAMGRAQAVYGIQQYGALISVVRVALGILPMHRKVRILLDNLVRVGNEEGGNVFALTEADGVFYVDDSACPQCLGMSSHSPTCASGKGSILQAILGMIPNAPLQVDEIACKAKGDATCRFRLTLTENKPI